MSIVRAVRSRNALAVSSSAKVATTFVMNGPASPWVNPAWVISSGLITDRGTRPSQMSSAAGSRACASQPRGRSFRASTTSSSLGASGSTVGSGLSPSCIVRRARAPRPGSACSRGNRHRRAPRSAAPGAPSGPPAARRRPLHDAAVGPAAAAGAVGRHPPGLPGAGVPERRGSGPGRVGPGARRPWRRPRGDRAGAALAGQVLGWGPRVGHGPRAGRGSTGTEGPGVGEGPGRRTGVAGRPRAVRSSAAHRGRSAGVVAVDGRAPASQASAAQSSSVLAAGALRERGARAHGFGSLCPAGRVRSTLRATGRGRRRRVGWCSAAIGIAGVRAVGSSRLLVLFVLVLGVVEIRVGLGLGGGREATTTATGGARGRHGVVGPVVAVPPAQGGGVLLLAVPPWRRGLVVAAGQRPSCPRCSGDED